MAFVDCPVEVYQSEAEFMRLLDLYRAAQPCRVLEIGSLFGGTLWHWMRETLPGGTFAVVDLLVPRNDERHARQAAGHHWLWQGWAREHRHKLTIIEMPSGLPSTKAVLPFDSVDFLFIDGAHDYESVRRDYELYAPLVRPGGMVAFHDIDIDKGEHYGVKPFWHELKAAGHKTDEWIETPGWWGIGVVHVS